MKKTIIISSLVASLLFAGVAFAAPTVGNIFRTILPETDNLYDIGSSTRKWANGFFTNISGNTANFSTLNASTSNIGTLTISSLATSPLIVGGSATTTIYGNGATSTFGGALSATGGIFSGSVGIGTTAPGGKLDVNGAVVISPNTAGKNTFTFGTGNVDQGRLKIYEDTTERIRLLAGGDSFFSTGNVGIGTTTPSYRLHTYFSSGNSENRFQTVGTGYSILSFLNSQTNVYIGINDNAGTGLMASGGLSNAALFYTLGTYGLQLGTNNLPRLTILSTGNIGIGTTAPANKLDIYGGNAYIENVSSLGSELITNGDFTSTSTWSAGTGWAIGSGVATKTAGTASNLSQPTTVASRKYRVVFTVSGYSAGTVRVQLSGGGGGAGTARSADGTYTEDIVAGTSAGGNFYITADAAFAGSIDNVSIKEIIGGNLTLRGQLLGGGTSGLKVDAAGNVGIGTTTPDKKLVVKGDEIKLLADEGTNRIRLVNSGDGNGAVIHLANSVGTTNTLFNSDGVSYFNGGNVGIGTDTPTYKLHVAGTLYTSDTASLYTAGNGVDAAKIGRLSFGSITNGYGQFGEGFSFSGSDYVYRYSDYATKINMGSIIGFDTAPVGTVGNNVTFTRRMTITNAGLVGIGTTAPGQSLAIKTSSTDNAQIRLYSDTAGGHIDSIAGAAAGHLYLQPASGVVPIYTSGVDGILRITKGDGVITTLLNASGTSYMNGGNVGIGIATPAFPLHVYSTASSTMGIGASTKSGCLVMGNSDNSAGLNYITVLNGVISATTTKPAICQ